MSEIPILKRPSYPNGLLDSTDNAPHRRKSHRFSRSIVPILPPMPPGQGNRPVSQTRLRSRDKQPSPISDSLFPRKVRSPSIDTRVSSRGHQSVQGHRRRRLSGLRELMAARLDRHICVQPDGHRTIDGRAVTVLCLAAQPTRWRVGSVGSSAADTLINIADERHTRVSH